MKTPNRTQHDTGAPSKPTRHSAISPINRFLCAAALALLPLFLLQPTATAQTSFAARNSAQDLNNLNEDDGINSPYGLWSDGQTLWVLNSSRDPKLFAYDLATKSRDPAKDIGDLKAAGITTPTGIWSDGTTMWVLATGNDKIYAYKMSDKSRDPAKDFDTLSAAGNNRPRALWSDGTTMWVSDAADKLYAYKMSDKSRDTAKDIATSHADGNRYPHGLWSDGTTMWVANYAGSDNNANNKIYAYKMSDKSRDSAKDFDTLSAAGNNQPRGIWSDRTTMWVTDSQDDKIYAYRLSDAEALSSLSLSGLSLSPAFDSGTARYTASIVQSGAQTTVAATAAQSTASVSISPADADTSTAGHQVALANGEETYIIISATPSSGTIWGRAYIVVVTNLFTTRNPLQDFDTLDAAGNTAPRSLWSDGETMWVADAKVDKLCAYNLVDKTRNPDKDFNTLSAAGNGGPRGMWSNGVTMWVVDDGDDKIYAYKISDKSRDPTKDFDDMRVHGNVNPVGLWSDGVTMWVADYWDAKIYAYKISDKSRDPAKDFSTLSAAGNTEPWGGMWSDGTTMWVTDNEDDKIYAYKMSDKSRDPAKDFNTLNIAGNMAIRGLWSDCTTLWVADDGTDDLSYSSDSGGNKLYAYHLSNNAVLSSLSLSDNTKLTPSFDGVIARYTASVPYAITNLTIAAMALHTNAMVSILPTDAAPNTAGHQAPLSEGVNDITITVTPSSGSARTYTVTVTRETFVTSRHPAQDFDTLIAAGNRYPHSLWSDGTTMWVGDSVDDKLYAYNLVTKQRDTTKDFNSLIAAGNTSPRGLWSDGTTMWVENGQDSKIYAYNLITKQRDPTKDFNSLIAAGNTSPSGLWSDGTTMWVADSADGKIYAYNLTTKQRDSTKDFNSLVDAGNIAPIRMWSDGTTLWAGDYWDDKLYAYNLASKQRDPIKDFNTLAAAGNDYPRGIWSDGTTMWISDPYGNRDKIYAYHQPPAPSGDNTLKTLRLTNLLNFGAFSTSTTNYTGAVATSTAVTTVTAVANHAQASVSILPADADSATAGHQVALAEGSNTITITVTAENGSVKNYTVAVTRPPRSGDNNLQSLSVSDAALWPAFLPIGTRYTANVDHAVAATTVTASARHPAATLVLSPPDADANTVGHQVVLSEGNNIITVTVTASNGDTKDYVLTIRRASIGMTGWNPLQDFDLVSTNTAPRGIWSDGETIWVADNEDDKLYAYNLVDGRRLASSSDFNTLKAAGNEQPRGLWSDGQTMWISDNGDDKIYAYNLSSTSHVSTNDFTLASTNTAPRGIWSDGETMWVADDGATTNRVYAYNMADKMRNIAKEFGLAVGNDDPEGMWSDGKTLWVADKEDAKLYAYNLANGRRESGKDFNTLQAAGNGSPRGLWSDGAIMWVVDAMDNKLYAYNRLFAGASSLRELDLDKVSLSAGLNRETIALFPDFDPVVTHYTVDVVHGYDTIVVNSAVPSYSESTVIISPPNALPDIDNHAVRLAEGANTITFAVTAPNRSGRTYTVTVNRAFPGDAFLLGSLSLSDVVSGSIANFSSSVTNYTAIVNHTTSSATVTATTNHADADILILPGDTDPNTAGHQVALAIGSNTITITAIDPNCIPRTYTVIVTRRGATSRIPEKDFDISGGIGFPYDLWSDGTTMWVTDWLRSEIRAYNLGDTNLVAKSRVPGKDFKTLKAAGNDKPAGIWSNGTTMWVTDLDDRRIYAYNLGDTNLVAKSRVRGKEFNTLDPHNKYPVAIWSDGTTMWVLNTRSMNDKNAKIYAYKMSDKGRDSGKDFSTLEIAENNNPWGIWSNGTTMWVTDSDDDKIYAYNLGDTKQEFGCRVSNKDFDTLKSAGNLNPHGIWSDGGTMWVVDSNTKDLYAYILPQSSATLPAAASGDPGLSAMALSGVGLNPVFSSHNSIYTATVAHTVTSTTITATPNHSASTVNILPASSNAGGVGGSSGGHRVALKEGRNIITVDVTAEDGSTRTYAVLITRAESPQSSSSGALWQGEESQSTAQTFPPLAVGKYSDSSSGGVWSHLMSAETLTDGGVRFVFLVPAEEFQIEEIDNLLVGKWRPLEDDEFTAVRESNVDSQDRLTVILPQADGEQRFLRLTPQR